MVVYNWNDTSLRMVHGGSHKKRKAICSPTAVPGDSCTQYSESGLVSNLYQVRIASYLHHHFIAQRPAANT